MPGWDADRRRGPGGQILIAALATVYTLFLLAVSIAGAVLGIVALAAGWISL
ncbi:hypothetical protein AB0M47_21895 [Hamadaea sp. NPDC051192]|uniref:hypothetical protein n=1 Tax=Hamadaea sp. NPDC051192 TaxID=3154940 RepID=UPI003426602A